MLSRTAASLYWIAPLPRTGRNHRPPDGVWGFRNALLPNTGGGYRNEWAAILQASGCAQAFAEKFGPGTPVQRDVETFLFFDAENPSRGRLLTAASAENARIVRTALTSLCLGRGAERRLPQELRQMQPHRAQQAAPARSHRLDRRNRAQVRGAIEGRSCATNGYHSWERLRHRVRADNTARMLDVEITTFCCPVLTFCGLGPSTPTRWTTPVCRAMSAHRAYGWAYGGELTPARIAHFLILNRQFRRRC